MNYQCPMCKGELKMVYGDKLHPNDKEYGITIYCPHKECPAQEVMGHGTTESKAYEVITNKFKS